MKIVSVNIEGRKHLSRVENLIKNEEPAVLFLQEVCQQDVEFFANLVGGQHIFTPMCFRQEWNDHLGVAIFSQFPATFEIEILKKQEVNEDLSQGESYEDLFLSQSFYVQWANVISPAGETFCFANTHLPVTEEGEVTTYQLEMVDKLLAILAQKSELVLVGDSNAPRGRAAFSKLSEVYIDNIPSHYTTSLDATLHRAGSLEFMIDMLFSTPSYRIENVRLISGVSDHCAVSAEVF